MLEFEKSISWKESHGDFASLMDIVVGVINGTQMTGGLIFV